MAFQKKLTEALFSDELPSREEIEKRYPPRELKTGAMVTRVAPSPTGFMHLGGLYAALISERLARQSSGVFYVRIEDTDKKREVEGAATAIVRKLENYGLSIDEGPIQNGDEHGAYGPYTQSKREKLYHVHIADLVERGLAYPCFCTVEQLDELRALQEIQRARLGYYGQWAACRKLTDEQAIEKIRLGMPYAMRFRSNGDFSKKIPFHDLLKGERELAENDQDIVIMKSDGLPTYHFAHVIDDHTMRTTHILRGDEWFASVSLHIQLFSCFSWEPPQYGHFAPIQKMDGSTRRKLSKRHDKEANIDYYTEAGYPKPAVIEYLLNLADSAFEDWRTQHPNMPDTSYELRFERLASAAGGALFDIVKLESVSKDMIAALSAPDVYSHALDWAQVFDRPLADILEQYKEYAIAALGIERSEDGKGRKDIAKWSDVPREIGYFFDEYFRFTEDAIRESLQGISDTIIHSCIQEFIENYDETASKEQWFDTIKSIATKNGYAQSQKEFKSSPDKYKGSVADIVKIFRVLLTGRTQTPDLHAIMIVMGKERVFRRLSVGLDKK